MKKLLALTLIAGTAVTMASACAKTETNILEQKHEDGIYRGNFIDKGINQIGIEFTIADNVVTKITWRNLQYGTCVLNATYNASNCTNLTDETNFNKIKGQYDAALNNLKDKNINAVAAYEKGDITSVVAGATTGSRFNKIRFAVIDGLLHGKYE